MKVNHKFEVGNFMVNSFTLILNAYVIAKYLVKDLVLHIHPFWADQFLVLG